MVFHGIHAMPRKFIDPHWKEYLLMCGGEGQFRSNSGTHLQETSQNKLLSTKTEKMKRKSSDKNMSTPLPCKNQPNPGKSLCLCLIRLNKSLRIHLYTLRKKMDSNFSDNHRSTTIPGKTQPRLENSYMPLPDQIQHKYQNTPITAKTK